MQSNIDSNSMDLFSLADTGHDWIVLSRHHLLCLIMAQAKLPQELSFPLVAQALAF